MSTTTTTTTNPPPPPIPPTMRIYRILANGPPTSSSLALLPSAPTPSSPTSSNLLIRISHAALNPVDLHFMNVLPIWLPFRRQPTPGLDFSGTIISVGPSVKEHKVGDKVCGSLGVGQITRGVGTLADYVVVGEGSVTSVPEGVKMEEAAAWSGIAGQTAALMVEHAGGLRKGEGKDGKGERVLINGASGGVGSFLTQMAKGRGAYVVAVCSGKNEGYVRGLGADEHVDYSRKDPDLEGWLEERFGKEKLDWIFDCAGGQRLYERCPGYLKEGGRFITIVGGKSQGIVPFVRNKMRPVMLGGTPRPFDLLALVPSGKQAGEVREMVVSGVVKETPIDHLYGMEEVVEAYEKLASKHARGKIIVKVEE